jgi:hypothetical protein
MTENPSFLTQAREFAYVPEAVENCWRGAWGGYTEPERVEFLEDLSAAVDFAFNISDDDSDQGSILVSAILHAATYISAQPCTCTEDEPCHRCLALGRYFDKRNDR